MTRIANRPPTQRPATMIAAAENERRSLRRASGELARLVAELEAATDPHAALRRIAALRQALDDVERANVVRALDGGASLAAIGRDLGISRQAVHRRYGDLATGLRAEYDAAVRPPRPSGSPTASCSPTRRGSRCATPSPRRRRRGTWCSAASTCCSRCCGPGPCPRSSDVSQERARTHILAASSGSNVFAREGVRPDARAFLIAVAVEARRRGSDRITPELLLLTALAEPDSAAARTLRAIGADPDAIAAALASGERR